MEALRAALQTEAKVTDSIKRVISVCESVRGANDYHMVDVLTSDFLAEQYHGQRVLAGQIASLSKMMDKSGALGLFLFDKELLAKE